MRGGNLLVLKSGIEMKTSELIEILKKIQEDHVMYLGYIFDTNDDIQDVCTKGQIMFVSSPYSLQELFEHYEICANGEWQPFGIEE